MSVKAFSPPPGLNGHNFFLSSSSFTDTNIIFFLKITNMFSLSAKTNIFLADKSLPPPLLTDMSAMNVSFFGRVPYCKPEKCACCNYHKVLKRNNMHSYQKTPIIPFSWMFFFARGGQNTYREISPQKRASSKNRTRVSVLKFTECLWQKTGLKKRHVICIHICNYPFIFGEQLIDWGQRS